MSDERRRFVKSQGTSVPATNSRSELEKIVTRYGCSSFSTQMDYDSHRITASFTVPDTLEKGAPRIPVQLEVSVLTVYDALYGRPMKGYGRDQVYNPQGYQETRLAQANRVAWRQLVLWVDAALCSAAVGMQPISEAFFAQTLLRQPNGTFVRIVDHVNQLAPGGNWKALIGPGVP